MIIDSGPYSRQPLTPLATVPGDGAGSARREQVLVDTATELLQRQDPEAGLEVVLRRLRQGLGPVAVMIFGNRGARHWRLLASNADMAVSSADTAAVQSLCARTVAAGRPLLIRDAGPETAGIPGARFDGRRPVGWMSCCVHDGPEPSGVIGVLSDRGSPFTQEEAGFLQSVARLLGAARLRLQAEARLYTLQQQLAVADIRRLQDMLCDGLAHEMNQPLAACQMYLYAGLNLIRDGAAAANREVPRLQIRVIEELRRISGILGCLRADMDGPDTEFRRGDLNSVIEDVLLLLRFDLSDPGIRVERRLQNGLPDIRMDRIMILKLLLILVRTCMESMNCSVRRVLAVSTERLDAGRVRVGISGTAPGIGDGFRDILDPPAAGAGSKVSEPAICHYIIEAHDGGFSLSANRDRGSTFHIILPV